MPVLGVPYDGSTYFNSGSLYAADAARDTRTGSSARHDVHNLPSFRGGGDPAGAHPRHRCISSITTATPAPVPPATAARPRHGGQPAARYAGSLLESTRRRDQRVLPRRTAETQRTRRSESTRHVQSGTRLQGRYSQVGPHPASRGSRLRGVRTPWSTSPRPQGAPPCAYISSPPPINAQGPKSGIAGTAAHDMHLAKVLIRLLPPRRQAVRLACGRWRIRCLAGRSCHDQ